MILKVPNNNIWTDHLARRLAEAKEIGLLREIDEFPILQTLVFCPDTFSQETVERIDPCIPLDHYSEQQRHSGWVKRTDLFNEAAAWIKERYGDQANIELLCEAGFSRQGDKVLESRPHIVLGASVFYFSGLKSPSDESIERVLKWSRSSRVLAVISEVEKNKLLEDRYKYAFICDVFSGDSLAIFTKER